MSISHVPLPSELLICPGPTQQNSGTSQQGRPTYCALEANAISRIVLFGNAAFDYQAFLIVQTVSINQRCLIIFVEELFFA